MTKNTPKASLRDISLAAGVSISTVSLALQNKAVVSAATRELVLRTAQQLGYAPDARLSSLMAGVRKVTSQDLLPIAWLNTSWQRQAWQTYPFHTPYIEGSRERALQLGYKIEEIWCHEPGMTMKRLSRILYERGIEGVIVTHPARHFRLNWAHLASVTIGWSLLAPKLHRVTADLNFNLLLAVKSLRRLGYRRIGICLQEAANSPTLQTLAATGQYLYTQSSRLERIPPLFHSSLTYYEMIKFKDHGSSLKGAEMVAWLKRYRPEVIVGHDNHLMTWLEAAGFRVPQDVGVVHLAVDDDVLDWAGIHSRRREIGATAVDQLVSLIRNRQFGVPKVPLTILVRGSWQNGRTLKRVPPSTPLELVRNSARRTTRPHSRN